MLLKMFHIPKKDRKTWVTSIVSHGLLFAIIFCFSLHSQFDISTSKVNSYSSISTVKNNLKSCHGNQACAALTSPLVDWSSILHSSLLILTDKQNILDGHPFGSRQIRAPPLSIRFNSH